MKRYEIYLIIMAVVTFAMLYMSIKYRFKYSIIIFCVTLSLLIFTAFFFRDPKRIIVQNDNAIIAPADGRIMDIQYGDDDRTKVYIFLSLFDVHRFRNPVSGEVKSIEYSKGEFKSAFHKNAKDKNEANKVTIINENGEQVDVTQVTGFIARRIICDIKENDRVIQGEQYGMIYFGSGCLLEFPSSYKINKDIAVNSKVQAGLNTIAEKENN